VCHCVILFIEIGSKVHGAKLIHHFLVLLSQPVEFIHQITTFVRFPRDIIYDISRRAEEIAQKDGLLIFRTRRKDRILDLNDLRGYLEKLRSGYSVRRAPSAQVGDRR